MRILKILGLVVAGLVALVLLAFGTVYLLGGRRISRKHEVPPTAIAIPTDSASVARGAHIVSAISVCTQCHGVDLGGKLMADDKAFGLLIAPNLTRGRGGRGAVLGDADFVRAIRHGVRTDSTSLVVMPAEIFVHMNDQDLGAVIAYVKQVPPVDRELERTQLRILGRLLVGAGQAPLLTAESAAREKPSREVVAPGATVEYGRYIVSIAGCHACHGPSLSGGVMPSGPPGATASANLTPGGRIASWSEADFIRTLREGIRPDGSPLLPDMMPWKTFKNMTDDELHAVWLYLKSLPAKEMGAQ